MDRILYVEGGSELLDSVGPLWERLNEHHRQNSVHFTERYSSFTFEKRKAGLEEKLKDSAMKIFLARDTAWDRYVGYCICTINSEKTGEIESLYVDPDCRGLGIGQSLMEKSLCWMDEQKTAKKLLGVAAGNEQAFSFYSRFGFYPKTSILEQK